MADLVKSKTFDAWFSQLQDRHGRAKIAVRLDRLAVGNPGDVRPTGSGLSEMRIDVGPGYRVYYMKHGDRVIILLAGGDKSTQKDDIRQAKAVAERFRDRLTDQ